MGSLIFNETTERLTRIYQKASHVPQVSARFREWQRFRTLTSGELATDDSNFISQTYLALLARFTTRRFLNPRRPILNTEELLEVVNIDYFTRRGISNFGEGDIFSWLLIEPRWELNLGGLVLETVQGLSDAVGEHDFSDPSSGVLDPIFHQLAPANHPVPRWLAEYIVEDELGLAENSSLSLLDPACGTGTFLCAAIGAMSQAIARSGGDPIDVVFEAPDRIRGMDSDPLSVALARLNYLLALGELVQEEHPPFLMPIYLADASVVRPKEKSVSTLSTSAGDFPLPDPVIENPLMLDWILGRLTNYMDGAQLRLHVQDEEIATQEVLNAYYNYLTAPKPRTPVPEALTPEQADTLLETARSLIQLHIQGEGTLWLHLVQNMAAPIIFGQRRFDTLAGQLNAASHDVILDSGLTRGGLTAVVMPLDESEARSGGHRVVNLEEALPNSALLMSETGDHTRLELAGEPIAFDASWGEAKAGVRFVPEP